MLCSAEVSRDSRIANWETTIPRMPTGTLMKKIQFQFRFSTIRPPPSGPIASASADTPAQIPIACPRCFGGKVATMMESDAGFMSAAPAPCTARAPIRKPALGASPQASEESVKIASPTTKIRRRPYRSASLPPVIRSAANVSA